jgi:DNA-binding transcriptional MerR regulator
MKIGKLALVADTKVETVRFYESIGLLGSPTRSESNYRIYDGDAVARLSFIRRARSLGFSIEEIRQLLELADDQGRSCSAVDVLARRHLQAVDQKLADLQALRQGLDDIIGQCSNGTIAECQIIDALSPRTA